MSKHTPGPWNVVVDKTGLVQVREADRNDICILSGNNNDGSNGRLIAAAPDLLEVLSIALELLRKVDPFPGQADILSGCIEAGSAVIAKATGSAA